MRGLDPMYFDRRRSIESALNWGGLDSQPRNAIDVGANVGQTLENFVSWWPHLQCLSIEPIPEAFSALKHTAMKLGQRAEVINKGVDSKSGSMKLHVSRTQTTNSSFHKFN